MVKMTIQAVNRSHAPVQLESVTVGAMEPVRAAEPLAYNRLVTRSIEWRAERGATPLAAIFRLRVAGEEVALQRPVWNRFVDNVRGELTRPFVVVPPVSVRIAEPVAIFPSAAAKSVAVQVHSYGKGRAGSIKLQLPAGWKIDPAEAAFQLASDGQEATVRFQVTPPAGAASAEARAVAFVDGREIAEQVLVIDYPHIPPQTLFLAASAKLVRASVDVRAKRVGYVMGAGDQIAELLPQIGVEVTLLNEEDLARGDLSRFDVIVTGVRAYNTREDLRANQHRLMDYVRNGGTVVVQYNVAERGFTASTPGHLDRIGPYPLTTGRDRVSVEEAAIEILKPAHPLLAVPNVISGADWSGWVQERGLYFASGWDENYEALVSTHDPGEPARNGGLLYARYGRGVYVFTAFSWFRQLPAGVPGAWRIFANLLSAGNAQ
jgi:hypothetical protein